MLDFKVEPRLEALYRYTRNQGFGIRLGAENMYLGRKTASGVFHHGWFEIELNLMNISNKFITVPDIHSQIARNLAHELGHFFVAPKSRRFKPDYGIPIRERTIKANLYWDLDEVKAVLVERSILDHFGFHQKRPRKDILAHMRRNPRDRGLRAKAYRWWRAEGQAMVAEALKSGANHV